MAYLKILLPVMKKSMAWVAGEETSQRYLKPIPTADTMRYGYSKNNGSQHLIELKDSVSNQSIYKKGW